MKRYSNAKQLETHRQPQLSASRCVTSILHPFSLFLFSLHTTRVYRHSLQWINLSRVFEGDHHQRCACWCISSRQISRVSSESIFKRAVREQQWESRSEREAAALSTQEKDEKWRRWATFKLRKCEINFYSIDKCQLKWPPSLICCVPLKCARFVACTGKQRHLHWIVKSIEEREREREREKKKVRRKLKSGRRHSWHLQEAAFRTWMNRGGPLRSKQTITLDLCKSDPSSLASFICAPSLFALSREREHTSPAPPMMDLCFT